MISLFNISVTGDTTMAASAREVHKYLEVREPFSTWWSQLLKYKFHEEDYRDRIIMKNMLIESNWSMWDGPNGDADLSLYMVKQIALMTNNDKGLVLYDHIDDYERNILHANDAITEKYSRQPRF